MFFEKRVIYQLLNRSPIIWIFLQTTVQKISNLHWNCSRWWNFYLVFDYFNQLLLLGYLERILSNSHLVHHNSDRPNIYFLIVLSSFQYLRTDVEGCTTKSCSQFIILMHRPSEITQLNYVLNSRYGTSWITIFSGLISLCIILKVWIYLTASHTCFMICAILTSERGRDSSSRW